MYWAHVRIPEEVCEGTIISTVGKSYGLNFQSTRKDRRGSIARLETPYQSESLGLVLLEGSQLIDPGFEAKVLSRGGVQGVLGGALGVHIFSKLQGWRKLSGLGVQI